MDPGSYPDKVAHWRRSFTPNHIGVAETFALLGTRYVRRATLTPRLESKYQGQDTSKMFLLHVSRRVEFELTDVLVYRGRQYEPVNVEYESDAQSPSACVVTVQALDAKRAKVLA